MTSSTIHGVVQECLGDDRRFAGAMCEVIRGLEPTIPESDCTADGSRAITCPDCLEALLQLEVDDIADEMEQRQPFVRAEQFDQIFFSVPQAAQAMGAEESFVRVLVERGDVRVCGILAEPDEIGDRVCGGDIVRASPESERALVTRRLDAVYKLRLDESY